jgi:hypothetical protein
MNDQEIKKAEQVCKAIECGFVGLAAGWLTVSGLLLALAPTPLGLLATALALVTLVIVICVTAE